MTKYTEPTSIIDSHVGHYITCEALEWCLDNGWEPDDVDDIRHNIHLYREGAQHVDYAAEILYDALNDAEDWATDSLTNNGMYFGTHPDIGDWGCWPIDDNWPE